MEDWLHRGRLGWAFVRPIPELKWMRFGKYGDPGTTPSFRGCEATRKEIMIR